MFLSSTHLVGRLRSNTSYFNADFDFFLSKKYHVIQFQSKSTKLQQLIQVPISVVLSLVINLTIFVTMVIDSNILFISIRNLFKSNLINLYRQCYYKDINHG